MSPNERPWRPIERVGVGVTMLAFWGLVAFLALTMLTACDPANGQACNHVGDTWAKGGNVLHCKRFGVGDSRWSK